MPELSQQTIDTVKATAPILEERGEEITSHFYKRLFENHPELRNVFNQTNQRRGRQPQALANVVLAAAKNIDQLENVLPVVHQVAHKHRSLQIKPEQYPIVGENLLGAMKDVLQDAATDDVLAAWEEAYGVISDVFISVEKEKYEKAAEQTGGWDGYRSFIVDKKVPESSVITSFYLRPEDGESLPAFQPGQYITLKAEIPGEKYVHLRQYSLSAAPGNDYFRISVKREEGQGTYPDGVVSSYLHQSVNTGDVLELTAPAGDFYLQESDRPVVLISGGVGLTPLMSMFHTLAEENKRPVTFIQAAQNREQHAMFEETAQKAEEHDHIHYHVCYDHVRDEDKSNPYIQKEGRIDAEWLRSILPEEEADYYFCGPPLFLKAMNQILTKSFRISQDRIHFEFFGPALDLEAVE
ncbi:nitric oxide dioxygenase [Alteribacillus persepolensis]|uniref:Flavohemoprotein n=1 Tax=Alteribacillus persepolensis TaxID=568899 RepID=A0A1G8GJT1_9BACI|nr:NO-inducible flavohemoprotein [Alteribacillus persepolensis]SDH94655.1 nitric oxide dioxygenase [Alteribacillus persepolensis]